jgi:hypothetical protein
MAAAVAAGQMLVLAGPALAQAGTCETSDPSPRCVMLRDLEKDEAKLKIQAEGAKTITLPSASRPTVGYGSGDRGGSRALGNLKEEESLRLNRQILEQLK